MTKSPRAVAREALRLGREAYFSKFSRKDFTKHQLFALLVLKIFPPECARGVAAAPVVKSQVLETDAFVLCKVTRHCGGKSGE